MLTSYDSGTGEADGHRPIESRRARGRRAISEGFGSVVGGDCPAFVAPYSDFTQTRYPVQGAFWEDTATSIALVSPFWEHECMLST
jgi:hypothetical protein